MKQYGRKKAVEPDVSRAGYALSASDERDDGAVRG